MSSDPGYCRSAEVPRYTPRSSQRLRWQMHYDEVDGKLRPITEGDHEINKLPMKYYRSLRSTSISEKVKCLTCGKLYASKKSLKIHVRIHTGYKPYMCHLCPKRFTQTNVLKAHINFHIGRRDWICRICKKAFTQSAHLRTHEKTHVQQKDYDCSFCQQSFSSKGVRDRHLRQHTGEKPYRCNLCSKSFTRGEALKFHNNAHQGIRPFHCPEARCSSSFTKQSSLKRHIATCHENLRIDDRCRLNGSSKAWDHHYPWHTLSPPAVCTVEIGEEEQVVAKVEKMGRLDEVLGEVLKLTKSVNVEKMLKTEGVFDEVFELSKNVPEKTCSESLLPYYSHVMMLQGQYIKQEEPMTEFMDYSFGENVPLDYSPAKHTVVDHYDGNRQQLGGTWDPDYSSYPAQYWQSLMMV